MDNSRKEYYLLLPLAVMHCKMNRINESVNLGRSQIRMELVGPVLVSLGPDVSEISLMRAAWSDMAVCEQGCFSGTR